MGRTQQFDTAEVVRAARDVFWANGYEASSIPDLEAATGLKRSSIYHAFGSKQGLFETVIESYLTEVVRPRLAPLTAPTVAAGALEGYLTGLRAALLDAGTTAATSGCLLVNTAGAPISQDAAVSRVIADYRAELRGAFENGVAARLPSVADTEVAVLADVCTGLVIAAVALVRVTPDAAIASIDAALALLGERAAQG
ncbi:MAG: TetR/AcrR family transcriptional regulator [Leucobacter sp.]